MKSKSKAAIVTIAIVGVTVGTLVFSAGEAMALLTSRARAIQSEQPSVGATCPAGKIMSASGTCV